MQRIAERGFNAEAAENAEKVFCRECASMPFRAEVYALHALGFPMRGRLQCCASDVVSVETQLREQG
jgi:hypothetical protein